MTIRPALKSGITIHRNESRNEVRIGSRWRQDSLPLQWCGVGTEALLGLLDGKFTFSELATTTGLESSAIESFVNTVSAMFRNGRRPLSNHQAGVL